MYWKNTDFQWQFLELSKHIHILLAVIMRILCVTVTHVNPVVKMKIRYRISLLTLLIKVVLLLNNFYQFFSIEQKLVGK